MVGVKICGITNLEDAKKAAELGADALGFVFFSKSPRKIDPSVAKQIIEQLPTSVDSVGVFVNEKKKVVRNIAVNCNLDMLQFHGSESLEYCHKFSKDYKLIKAIRIKEEKSISEIEKYLDLDYILLDTYNKNLPGGTGEKFNWDLAIKAKAYHIPIILSGGLNPGNIEDAIEKVKPYMVDVSSGVEKKPGEKDYSLMKEFIEKVKSTDNRVHLPAGRQGEQKKSKYGES